MDITFSRFCTLSSVVMAAAILALCVCAGPAPAATLKVTTFECDVTPPLGQPIYSSYQPLAVIEHPLMAKGVVLDDGHDRYVLCAVDYCELRNEAHALFQREIAKAVGTAPDHVAVQSVHQHTAPMVDIDAVRIVEEFDNPPPHPENRVFQAAAVRLGKAAQESLAKLRTCDSLGLGEAKVDRVAATRRVKDKDGTIIVRWSSCTDPKLRAMPEGRIDPKIKVVTFAQGQRPLVRLFYYATHPQSFYGDPRASYDVPGIARERLEQEEGVTEIYFTGCAGDVTMGKYNDATKQARRELAERLHAGMQAAVAATDYAPIGSITWRTYPLVLPRRTDSGYSAEESRARLIDPKQVPSVRFYRGAIPLAFAARIDQPIELCALTIGKLHIVNLPGEPMIEFQLYAQSLLPDAFVAVAGYGDGCCGYLCTDAAYDEGGYEPTDTLVAPGAEAKLKEAIRSLLGAPSASPGH
jgi:hypothetical protein